MRVKTFKVPFSRIAPEDATELEFGADDYCMVRPLFGMPASALQSYQERIAAITSDDVTSDGEVARRRKLSDDLLMDMLNEAIIEWHLSDDSGPIPKPSTPEEVLNLPGALAGNLFNFLSNYRGGDPNPTTRQ